MQVRRRQHAAVSNITAGLACRADAHVRFCNGEKVSALKACHGCSDALLLQVLRLQGIRINPRVHGLRAIAHELPWHTLEHHVLWNTAEQLAYVVSRQGGQSRTGSLQKPHAKGIWACGDGCLLAFKEKAFLRE